MDTKTFPADQLKQFCKSVLEKYGLPDEDAAIVAESLLEANLRGVDSHGIARLGIYAKRLGMGLVNPRPQVEVLKDNEASLLVDGDNGMGQVVARRALDLGLQKVGRVGSVSVGVRNSNHYGAGAYYVERAVTRDVLAFAYSNAPSTMAPWGGVEPYIGTNPYACGVPAGEHEPLILDMATSVVARGKIILAAERGDSIPEGWAIDTEGRPTTDAGEALKGSVLPFGGPKGSALSLMIDVMAGLLTGAGFGPRIGNLYEEFDKPQNVGAFFSLIDIASFMPTTEFKQRVDVMIEEIKTSRRVPEIEEIFLPGEIESRTRRQRITAGVPLDLPTVTMLDEVGTHSGIRLQ